MKINPKTNSVLIALTLSISAAMILSSCKKDLSGPRQVVDEDAVTVPRTVYSNRAIDWNDRSDGTYTLSEADADFGSGSIVGWQDSKAGISSGTCRIKMLANALGSTGGMVAKIDISDGSEYQMQWDVKFHSAFDWSRGGKVGFGFLVGDGNTGGDPGWDGNGGSVRVTWGFIASSGRAIFHPYIYYKDQPTEDGDNFGVKYPAAGDGLQKGVWYTVKMYVRSNTGSSTNGHVRITINGTDIIDKDIRWTTNDAKRLFNRLDFATFRGGADSSYESSTDGLVYYDNLSWTRLAS